MVVSAAVTITDLLRLGSEDRQIEVIDGEIVEMTPVGVQHVALSFHVAKLLDKPVSEHGWGYVWPDGLIYILEEGTKGTVRRTRIPDVSFVRAGRLTEDFDISLPFPGAPNLAIEIISPSEGESVTLEKVRDYLAFGTEQVWVLYPKIGEVHQYRQSSPKTIRAYSGDDVMDVEDLFPGLVLKASDLFALGKLK